MICGILNLDLPVLLEGASGRIPEDVSNVLAEICRDRRLRGQISLNRPFGCSLRTVKELMSVTAETDIQMQVTAEDLDTAALLKPASCTLVRSWLGDSREIAASRYRDHLANAVREIKGWGGRVFIRVAPFEYDDLYAAAAAGADGIETVFQFPEQGDFKNQICYMERLNRYAEAAKEQRLQFSLTGNIDFINITAILRIEHLQRLDVSRAVFVSAVDSGWRSAVNDVMSLLQ